MDAWTDDWAARAWLADWRRRVAGLYAEVRDLWPDDPVRAWDVWRTGREALYRDHPQSPVPAADRACFRAVHWPYDDRLRWAVRIERPDQPPSAAITESPSPVARPASAPASLAFDRIGSLALHLPGGGARLSLFWMRGYAGGLFLPFGDATNGSETYGAGRYILDTAKGADLGGDPSAGSLVVDLNFAFHPSCAFDPRWACPLAPPENRLPMRVEAGERLR